LIENAHFVFVKIIIIKHNRYRTGLYRNILQSLVCASKIKTLGKCALVPDWYGTEVYD
jgi:hypothetical protein